MLIILKNSSVVVNNIIDPGRFHLLFTIIHLDIISLYIEG